MSAPFVTQLRTRGDVIQMAPAGAAAIMVRVEMPEVWDTVRVAVLPGEQPLAISGSWPGVRGAPTGACLLLDGWSVPGSLRGCWG